MRINLTSVMVDDQAKALKFYTEVLGFETKVDIPMGEFRWLTVVSPESREGTQLLLEPMAFAPSRVFQKALYDAGIPLTSFAVSDCQAEYERMRELGVVFRGEPRRMGPVLAVMFEDTCGNLIMMAQQD